MPDCSLDVRVLALALFDLQRSGWTRANALAEAIAGLLSHEPCFSVHQLKRPLGAPGLAGSASCA
jgi:hypothetical protein